ncbi:hypothetical protein [Nocardioides acrostichi]|uniref:Uncharacterized protein n=1 Tax=Nocardioides acrostichi TaxID=2784339 RepID=A0A930UU62_9ACTN|nr:hypothetical protein [Nocardioides acrostichi]MBF4160908.1 hypothetical protein [Nocardioides acrostichi]
MQIHRRPRYRQDGISPWPFVGLIGMAAVFFLVAASGPFTPWWAQTLLFLGWGAALVAAIRWWEPHPARVVWVPLACGVMWFVVILAGVSALGW